MSDLREMRCTHKGCNFVTRGTSDSIARRNLSSHVYVTHNLVTTIWYEGQRVRVERDPKTQEMMCPCKRYVYSNSRSLQKHAKHLHGDSGAPVEDMEPIEESLPVPSHPHSVSPIESPSFSQPSGRSTNEQALQLPRVQAGPSRKQKQAVQTNTSVAGTSQVSTQTHARAILKDEDLVPLVARPRPDEPLVSEVKARKPLLASPISPLSSLVAGKTRTEEIEPSDPHNFKAHKSTSTFIPLSNKAKSQKSVSNVTLHSIIGGNAASHRKASDLLAIGPSPAVSASVVAKCSTADILALSTTRTADSRSDKVAQLSVPTARKTSFGPSRKPPVTVSGAGSISIASSAYRRLDFKQIAGQKRAVSPLEPLPSRTKKAKSSATNANEPLLFKPLRPPKSVETCLPSPLPQYLNAPSEDDNSSEDIFPLLDPLRDADPVELPIAQPADRKCRMCGGAMNFCPFTYKNCKACRLKARENKKLKQQRKMRASFPTFWGEMRLVYAANGHGLNEEAQSLWDSPAREYQTEELCFEALKNAIDQWVKKDMNLFTFSGGYATICDRSPATRRRLNALFEKVKRTGLQVLIKPQAQPHCQAMQLGDGSYRSIWLVAGCNCQGSFGEDIQSVDEGKMCGGTVTIKIEESAEKEHLGIHGEIVTIEVDHLTKKSVSTNV